jgi:hypothetical protein
MVSGVVADKSKQRAAQAALFYAPRFPCSTNGLSRLKASSFTSFGTLEINQRCGSPEVHLAADAFYGISQLT